MSLFDSSLVASPTPFTSTIVDAASSAARLEAARDALRQCPPGAPVLIVGGSRSAVDELAR
ncbi:MAG TPA: hypothetical protein VF198_17650, partial [Vicinamibacterales bacterium]